MARRSAGLLLSALLAASAGLAEAGNSDIVDAARKQIGVTLRYDPAYQALKYPGGDVPPERGVCTDVIVRALRSARGQDLHPMIRTGVTQTIKESLLKNAKLRFASALPESERSGDLADGRGATLARVHAPAHRRLAGHLVQAAGRRGRGAHRRLVGR